MLVPRTSSIRGLMQYFARIHRLTPSQHYDFAVGCTVFTTTKYRAEVLVVKPQCMYTST
jgi:hypothetical protein